LRHLYTKVIFLPRQAQDKHRKNSKKARFVAGCVGGWLQGTTKPLASALGAGESLPTFVVASVTNVGHKRLGTLSLDALYAGDGKLHRHAAIKERSRLKSDDDDDDDDDVINYPAGGAGDAGRFGSWQEERGLPVFSWEKPDAATMASFMEHTADKGAGNGPFGPADWSRTEVRQRSLFSHFMVRTIIYQDRLRTKMEKTQNQGCFLAGCVPIRERSARGAAVDGRPRAGAR
jgi:hypothetical protein